MPSDQSQNDLSDLIAYIGQDGNVWLIDSDGNNNQQLTFDGSYERLVWSPDGQTLAITKYIKSSNQRQLYIKDLNSNPAQKLSDAVYSFAWDSGGDRIAYSSDQIYVYDVKDGGSEKIIPMGGGAGKNIPSGYELESLFWNISGDSLVYYSEGLEGIYLVNINTSTDTKLFSPSANNGLGEIIAQLIYTPLTGYFFGWDHSSQGYGIPLLMTPSGELTKLEEYGEHIDFGHPTAADWSSDGKYVTYGADGGHLFVVEVDPYNVKLVQGNGVNPRWSPDAKAIAFTTEKGGLNLLNVDTQQITQLLPDVSDKYLTQSCGFEPPCGDYGATAENEPKWSPDGRKIIQPYKLGFFTYNLESKGSKWVEDGVILTGSQVKVKFHE